MASSDLCAIELGSGFTSNLIKSASLMRAVSQEISKFLISFIKVHLSFSASLRARAILAPSSEIWSFWIFSPRARGFFSSTNLASSMHDSSVKLDASNCQKNCSPSSSAADLALLSKSAWAKRVRWRYAAQPWLCWGERKAKAAGLLEEGGLDTPALSSGRVLVTESQRRHCVIDGKQFIISSPLLMRCRLWICRIWKIGMHLNFLYV